MRLRTPSGSLCQFTQNKNGRTYPSVVGDRDPLNLHHWFWVYSFKTSADGKTRSKSVPRHLVESVKLAILDQQPISHILGLLNKSGKSTDAPIEPSVSPSLEALVPFGLRR